MLKAVLFDFDGTLVNTNDLIFSSHYHAFSVVQNRTPSKRELLSLYGRTLTESLREYGEDYKALYDAYMEFNELNHDKLIKKFDGAAQGVLMLKREGYKTAVVTSKNSHRLMRGLEFLRLTDAFDVLVTPECTDKHKPDPAPVLYACEKLGVAPENALMVGDSIFDLQAAKAAGCRTCAVSYSLTSERQLKELGPDYFVDSIVQLAEMLRKA